MGAYVADKIPVRLSRFALVAQLAFATRFCLGRFFSTMLFPQKGSQSIAMTGY